MPARPALEAHYYGSALSSDVSLQGLVL